MSAPPKLRQGLAAGLALALSACALEQPPSRADLTRDALPNTQVPAAWKAGEVAATPPPDAWLARYGDPTLSALVAEAQRHNADLQVAAARVEQAQAMLQAASSPMLPAIALKGSYSGSDGMTGGLNILLLSAVLELDVWGRMRYGQQAAQAQSAAAEADLGYARQSLAATVVKSWVLAIELGLQRALADDALRAARALHQVASDRMKVGPGDERSVAEAAAEVNNLRDVLRQLDQSRAQALRALELLLGRYPAAEVAVAPRLAPMPEPIPAGLPSDLLERRPDVVAAERRVAASFNRVGEAKAARLPSISLTAGINSVNSNLLVLQTRDNPGFGVGATLFAPLYLGGALQAQVDLRDAEQKQAMADYARIAQRCFGEVENALAADIALRERDALLARTIVDSERALELAKVQFRVGKVDLRVVEQRQLALYSARSAHLRVQADRLAQRANLYLALGGDFAGATPSR